MAFGGLSGLELKINTEVDGHLVPLDVLFAEEVGWVIEVDLKNVSYVTALYEKANLRCQYIGKAIGYGMNSAVGVHYFKN